MKKDIICGEETKVTYTIPYSPFRLNESEKDYDFFVAVPGSDEVIDGFVFVSSVITSLLEDSGECDVAVCGCGDGGCAGFWNERFSKTKDVVIWEIKYHGVLYEFDFDRSAYERDALAMLDDMVERNIGWNEFAIQQYRDFDEFKEAVRTTKERVKKMKMEEGKDWITIFPDFPMAFAWKRMACHESDLDGCVGACCGDVLAENKANVSEFLLSPGLSKKIFEWMMHWTDFADSLVEAKKIDWDREYAIDMEGIEIAKLIKVEIGGKYRLRYSRCHSWADGYPADRPPFSGKDWVVV